MMQNNVCMLVKAFNFAAIKHQCQRRKSGDIPYINHPIEVCNILAQAGVTNIDILCGAVLHDTVEDTNTSYEQIQNNFNSQIKQLVYQCSDDKSLTKINRKLKQIQKAKIVSNQAKMIKMADKISNNGNIIKQPPKEWGKQRVQGYLIWSYAVCSNLKGINNELDKRIDQIFNESGILLLKQEQMNNKLKDYYKIIDDSTD